METFEAFAEAARARGATEVLERRWEPLADTGVHSHPFAANALVVAGEFWLTVGDDTRHLKVGDRFELDAGIPHAERYGPEGATYWVARR